MTAQRVAVVGCLVVIRGSSCWPRRPAVAFWTKALVTAAHVPAVVIAVAEQVLSLAEQLLPIGNRNVISDVAAAAEAARAAATTARVNVEINLGGIKDAATWGELAAVVDTVDDLVLRAEKVTAAVRDGLVR